MPRQLFSDVHPSFASIVGMDDWWRFVFFFSSCSYKTPGEKVRFGNEHEETFNFVPITSI